ncbi:hypothetical protein [Homoserinimonas sp. OAct 916]|uniref:hypothetical protein n=1 Tax=Homoserinimonas sp. OAct 916 TaxID=2211450 RepID=UPI000DBE9E76|nr:hypothetical protein [Homoserinimonas sp. OAct 916]
MTNITPEDEQSAASGDKPFTVFQPGQAQQSDELSPVGATEHVNANGADRDAAADADPAAGDSQPDNVEQSAPPAQEQYTPAPDAQEQYEPAAQEQYTPAPVAHEPVEPLEPLAPAGSADTPVPLIEPEEPAALPPAYTEPAYSEPAYTEPAYTEPAYTEPTYDQAAAAGTAATMQQPAYNAPTEVYQQQPVDPTYPPQAGYPVTPAYAQQPTYIQAPIPPKKKGNRLGGSLITLLGTVIFALVYTGVAALIILLSQQGESLVNQLTNFLMSWVFWAPVAGFTIVLILIVLIVNNANWWAYVLGGFLVGVGTYFATIGGAMLAAQSWTMTADVGVEFLERVAFNPLTIASGLIAREVTIWIGGWIAARGRKVKARNIEAQAEFERQQAEQPAYAPQPVAYQQPVAYPQA